MKLANTITVESTRAMNGPMYVRAIVNGKEVSAVVDTRATHNFVDHGGLVETSDELAP